MVYVTVLAKIGLKCFVSWTFQGLLHSSLVAFCSTAKQLSLQQKLSGFCCCYSLCLENWDEKPQTIIVGATRNWYERAALLTLMASFSQLRRKREHWAEMHLSWVDCFVSSNVAHGICSIAYNGLQQKVEFCLHILFLPMWSREKKSGFSVSLEHFWLTNR